MSSIDCNSIHNCHFIENTRCILSTKPSLFILHFSWVKEKDVIPLAEYVPSWVAAGAKWIGGCCRVGPEDIRNIRAAMVNMHLIS